MSESDGDLPVKVFIGGPEREMAYKRAVKASGLDMISPGGAAMYLHCSRQYIHKLIGKGALRTWIYRRKASESATYCEIAYDDVVAYAERVGKGQPDPEGVDSCHL